jgi:hypothetical protein
MMVDDVCNVLRQLLPCCLALLRPDVFFINHHTYSTCRQAVSHSSQAALHGAVLVAAETMHGVVAA